MKLAADGNVKITTSQDTQTTSSDYQKHESGWGTSGGIGISVGSKTQADRSNTSQVTHIGSTIGSLNGNLNIAAGDHLHVSGSDLIAAKDVSGTGANVTIDAATDTMHHDETHEVKQSGFTLALKAPVLDALSNTVDQAHAASRSQDSRAAALHGMAAASGAVDMVGTGAAAAGALTNGQPPEVKLELSYGSSHSKSTFSEDSTTNKGSSVTAGGTAAFVATAQGASGHGAAGHGTSSNGAASGNVTIAGSHVKANDVLLSASNQVNLLNTTDTDSTRSTNQSSSASVGVSYGTQGLGVSASGSKAHGGDSSDAAMQNDTHVKGANSVQIVSGDDTNLIGAHLSGGQVTADIGGNLTIASVQDTATSHADQESSGGGFSISQGGGSASFSRTSGNANDSYAGVNEQAGIHAGSGGFDINVQGNTDLKGATIASEANASRNTLSTGTLSFSDIANSSSYDAKSGGFSAGATTGDGGANYRTHGASSGTNAGGAAPMLSQNDSGRDSAMTQSGVSAGTINVTDPAHQTQDVASLNRDTSNANGTVAKTPDVNTLLNNQADLMAAASAAGEAVSRRIGDYAESKMNEAKAAGDTAGVDAWKEGGANRAMMQAAGAALVTGLGSAMEGAAGAAGAGIASSLAAGKLNELSGAIADASPAGNATIDTALGNIVANVIATGAGAAVGGEVGALSAYNVDRFNRQLHPDERQWAKDNAKTFAQFYEGKTGRSITSDQAQQILLANGYIRVDQAAASGPGYDATAAQYITQYAGNLFTATPAEYKNPLLYGNANGSLTPEQRALPGAVANPTVGLVTAGVITGGLAAAPAVVAGTAAAIEACVINPVLCANHAGIAIGEIAAGGAVPAGTGAAVTGAVAGAGKAADKVGTARGATNSAAAGSAADMTTAAQLRTQLSFQEAGILDANGQLTPQAIQNSQPIALAGGKINNLAVVSELTSDGSKIADWGKYTTQSMDTSNGQSMQIHYYMNSVTGKIDYVTPDFKVKGVVKP
ncbi:hypothetical protein LMG28138_04218 [Pararobbsia alpina]|uniref:Uncharacterized protein n=1 Tax=Pararobbsia alpina TaxID=621374 RepID=A0A6S7BEW6_9BURK|nr:hypothetical protein LMG28138_04218 [Pararobbsia alpina]